LSATAPTAEYAAAQTIPASDWLRALRRYMAGVALANLVWEFAHMPLYTLWETGSPSEIAFAALHCTGGDILISLASVMLALILSGKASWPQVDSRRIIVVAVVLGLSYTLFSEWLNIEIRQSWAYRDIMPVVPLVDAGLSPVLQWIIVPLAAFWWALRPRSFSQRTEFDA
jgi:hypothetical protein